MLLITAFSFQFSFLASAISSIEKSNPLPIQDGSSKASKTYYKLEIEIYSNFPERDKDFQTLSKRFIDIIVVSDFDNKIKDIRKVSSNSLYSAYFEIGIYKIIFNLTVFIPAIIKGAIKNIPFTFKYESIKIILDKDKHFIVYFNYTKIKPEIANVYDFNGNSFLEFQEGEYLVAKSDTEQLSELIDKDFSPGWALLYLNGFAIAYTGTGGVFITRDYALYIFTDYPNYLADIDLRQTSNADVILITLKFSELT